MTTFSVSLALLRPPPCSAVLDPSCVQTVDNDHGGGGHPWGPPMPDLTEVGGNVMDSLARSFSDAVGWFISSTSSWWVQTDPPDLEKEPVIGLLQHLTQPITISVAMMALLIAAAKMMLTHKANPLVDMGRGLVVLTAVTAIGATLPNKLLQYGHEWTGWALSNASHGDFAARMTKIVTFPSGTPAAVVVILSIVALFIGIIQAFLMLFRGAALIILAGLLPLAAAGMITPATQPWFKKVAGWGLALIFYEPAAGAAYMTAFILIGNGHSLHAVLMGFTMMAVSLIAFPVLLKFFSWTTGDTQAGNSGGILGTVLNGAMTLGALQSYTANSGARHSRDSSANEHAGYLRQQLGDQEPGQRHQTDDDSNARPGDATPTGNAFAGGEASTPARDNSAPGAQPHDPASPTGSGHSAHGTGHAGEDRTSYGGGAADSPADEPIGPTSARAWDDERRQTTERIRWMGEPSGSGDTGGPTGAGAGGGGGGGA
ncbi:hypothetical protein J4573_08620 [Actinomadura barringtoniae]|uniref:Type IV secretion system protein n=1 Tax=Actinomadura barringtoniae TaxID=1427535 RepID=A0A939P7F1_9ACTN|nr:hypothetical protein [Actinomadura barringtoniae]MBO2447147.1 hypothetical protein [Actinomadura barringtoniae]